MSMHDRLANEFNCHLNAQGIMICEGDELKGQSCFITQSPKKVAVWGSARTKEDSKLFAAIQRMGRDLRNDNWIIVTGGGPGSMEAANRGAMEVCNDGEVCSIAQAIKLPFEEAVNPSVQSYEEHEEFFSRLKQFSEECDAFVVTPGGVGTLLELALIYQIVQVGHITKKPIICVGRMWRPLRDWMEREMVGSGFIAEDELQLVKYIDNFEDVAPFLRGLARS